ncbi:MAG: T9SS type A sorting domain-containing protein [bacterium]|nr:T9SS type A sorting domain-containing protein [bacterium]
MRVFLAALTIASVIASASDRLFVVNSLDESLGWIELDDGASDPQAATLGFLPNDIVALRDALCVVNSGDNNVQVIDPVTLQTIRLIELSDAVNPFAAASLGGDKIVVTASLSGTVSIVDWRAGAVDTTFHVGVGPQFVSSIWGKLYVLCTGVEYPVFGSGVLKRYDAQTFEFIDSLVVGINPQSLISAWSEIQVLCTGNYDDVEGSVVIVDTTGGLSIDTVLQIGGSPISMTLGSAPGIGSGWIAAGGWADEGYVFQYNAVEHEILHDEGNPIVIGTGAVDVGSQGYVGGSLYVSCFNESVVQVLNCWGEPSLAIEMSAGPSALDIWFGPVAADPETAPLSGPFEVVNAYPNPFNGTLNLLLGAPALRSETLTIFDLLGREVGAIPVRAGETLVQWRPGAGAGQEVSAGIYFARLRSGGNQVPVKVVYLK